MTTHDLMVVYVPEAPSVRVMLHTLIEAAFRGDAAAIFILAGQLAAVAFVAFAVFSLATAWLQEWVWERQHKARLRAAAAPRRSS